MGYLLPIFTILFAPSFVIWGELKSWVLWQSEHIWVVLTLIPTRTRHSDPFCYQNIFTQERMNSFCIPMTWYIFNITVVHTLWGAHPLVLQASHPNRIAHRHPSTTAGCQSKNWTHPHSHASSTFPLCLRLAVRLIYRRFWRRVQINKMRQSVHWVAFLMHKI